MGYFDEDHPTLLAEAVRAADHVRGPAAAPVTLVEFGDFACPFCAAAHGIIKDLLAEHPDIRFIFRANPRSHVFPHAELAAEAAEAAGAQGKYWEMHDLLFENQSTLSREEILRLASGLGLDMERLTREVDTGAHRPAVHEQEISGWHSHVLATPTFFINGIRFDDAPSALSGAVRRAISKQAAGSATFREVRVQSTEGRRRHTISVGHHRLTSDHPVSEEGDDAGPGPYELLGAALGSCTAMTIRWVAERKKIPLRGVDVRLSQSRSPSGHLFRLSIELDGDLDEAQRAELERAAERCPVSRTLRHQIEIVERVRVARLVDETGEESFPASDPPSWTLGRDPSAAD
jgi:uncharacterized OsmC-like protein/predicted DsbA family dithiol-disulfide isomerase